MRTIIYNYQVTNSHTAKVMGSGDLDVLATPALIAFAENACKELVAEELTVGQTTVGIEIELQHLKASKVGALIKLVPRVSERTKTIITYEFDAFDNEVLIGKGKHKRAIVDIDRFLNRLS